MPTVRGRLTRKDFDTEEIFFDAVLQDTNFYKRSAVVITGITNEAVKVQFLEKRSYQNFFPDYEKSFICATMSAYLNNAYGQDNLGCSYYYGESVEQSY